MKKFLHRKWIAIICPICFRFKRYGVWTKLSLEQVSDLATRVEQMRPKTEVCPECAKKQKELNELGVC